MNTKTFVWLGFFVGSSLGSLVPFIWGADFLSLSSIFGSAIGGLLGIWLGFKIGQRF